MDEEWGLSVCVWSEGTRYDFILMSHDVWFVDCSLSTTQNFTYHSIHKFYRYQNGNDNRINDLPIGLYTHTCIRLTFIVVFSIYCFHRLFFGNFFSFSSVFIFWSHSSLGICYFCFFSHCFSLSLIFRLYFPFSIFRVYGF